MPGEISAGDLASRLRKRKAIHLVDVREAWERAIAKLNDHQHIPLDELPQRMDEVKPPDGAQLVLYCHHGVRSLAAAEFLEQQGLAGVLSLRGGIDAWSAQVDSNVPAY